MGHLKKTLEHAEEEIGEVEVPDEVSDVPMRIMWSYDGHKTRSLW